MLTRTEMFRSYMVGGMFFFFLRLAIIGTDSFLQRIIHAEKLFPDKS